jgi:hypothetical protein
VNLDLVERIAEAVLYEGYMLYPYTASSVKNQKRFNFGVLSPPGGETSEMQTECLVAATGECEIGIRVRFLQMGDGGETVERRVLAGTGRHEFDFDGVRGEVDAALSPVQPGLERLTVKIRNCTTGPGEMLSVHTILTVRGGEFISLMDPPVEYATAAAECRNVGTWPVLAGIEGERDTMLSSPIILYDYPQLAPESPGNLFDATEIDEILTLRILTLSEEEKAEIRAGGERAREVLERSESLGPEQLRKLHGAVRGLRQVER